MSTSLKFMPPLLAAFIIYYLFFGFRHSCGNDSDHGSNSARKSRLVSSWCFGISV